MTHEITSDHRARIRAQIQSTLNAQLAAVKALQGQPVASMEAAVEIALSCPEPLIWCGVGKSGHIAQKVAASMSSLGTRSIFLHASEAMHGDLGAVHTAACVFLFSNSGKTQEILRLVPVLREYSAKLVAIVGNRDSPLSRQADVTIEARVEREADELNLAPTASALAALAVGDALACAISSAKGFTREDYSVRHPGGRLGAELTLRVGDLMRKGDEIPTVRPDSTAIEVLHEISRKRLGAACVLSTDGELLGVVTDGDIRRALESGKAVSELKACDMMNTNPRSVPPDCALVNAMQSLSFERKMLSLLPVVSLERKLLGVVWYHDAMTVGK